MASKEKPGQIFWYPVTGCEFIDNDCKGCWAKHYSSLRRGHGSPTFKKGFKPVAHPENLYEPHTWMYRHLVHVGATSDIFHRAFDDKFILDVFKVMNETPENEYLVQTKRSERMLQLSKKIKWTDNIWMGVTVTKSKYQDRIEHLRNTGAKIKWVAFHPLRNEIKNIDIKGIDWVVVGPPKDSWNKNLYNQRKKNIIDACILQGISYYDRDSYEYRELSKFTKGMFPKDLESLGVLSDDKNTTALIYFDSVKRRISQELFYGAVEYKLKLIKKYLSDNPKTIVIGLTPDESFCKRMEITLKLIAKKKDSDLAGMVGSFIQLNKKIGYEIRNNVVKLGTMKNIAIQRDEYDKLILLLRIYFDKAIGAI